jgi:hypothetical protein
MEVHPLEVAMYFNETPQCKCEKMFNFCEDNFNEGSDIFCKKDTESSIFDVMNCDNFKNFSKRFPVLGHLVSNIHSDIENISNLDDIQKLFTPKVIVCHYNKLEMVNTIKIFLKLVDSTKGTYYKAWICLSMYEFVLRNWKFCKDNKNFKKVFMFKWVDEFVPSEPIMVDLGRKINPYFDQYTEFFKDNIEYDNIKNNNTASNTCLRILSSKIDNFIVFAPLVQ